MSPSQSVAAQHTWRLRDPRDERSSSKRLRFAIWSVLFLLLLLLTAFLVNWMLEFQHTYMGVFVTQQDLFAAPHIAFQEHDKAAWDEFIRACEVSNTRYRSLPELTGLEHAANGFADSQAGPRDTQILFVSTHGIVHQGTACLMMSKFLSENNSFESGLYSAEELLSRLSESRAGLKLLVLDAGRVAYDPRLGVILNEFPDELERVLRTVKDDRLWVLVSHASGQVSGASSGAEHSLFAQSVLAGLRGEADRCGDVNSKVTLDELYQYVWSDLARWTKSGRPLQTPLLLRGGTGLVDVDEARRFKLAVMRVPEPQVQEDQKDDAGSGPQEGGKTSPAAKEQANAAAGGWQRRHMLGLAAATALQTADSSSPTTGPPAPTGGAGDQDAVAAKTSSGTEETATLDSGKDESSQAKPDSGAAAKPMDETTAPAPPPEPPLGEATKIPAPLADSPQQAPAESATTRLQQIWRLRDQLANGSAGGWSPIDFSPVNWRLLEAMIVGVEMRVRAGGESDDPDLPTLLGELSALAREMQPGGVSSQYTPGCLADIAQDWRDFRQDKQREILERSDMREVAIAWQLCNQMLYELPSFIRWQALSVLNDQDVSCSDTLRTNSIEHLIDLRTMLLAMGNTLTPDMAQRIRAQYNELKGVQEELQGNLQTAWRVANGAPNGPVTDRLIDVLLATPLLDVDRRWALLGKRDPAPLPSLEATKDPDNTMPELAWDALRKIVAWEIELIGICDPANTAPRPPQALNAANAGQLGQALQKYYEGVPQIITNSHDYSLVWLVDPRDKSKDRRVAWRPLFPPTGPPPLPVKLEIVRAPDGPIRLDWHRPVEAVVQFAGQGLKDNRVTAHVQFDTQRLVVRSSPQGDPLDNDASIELDLNEDLTHQFVLYLAATRQANANKESADLSVYFTGVDVEGKPRKTERQPVVVQLPLASDVTVWTVRYNDRPKESEFANGSRIEPYPNRTTPFTFLLANRSQVSKDVKVELFAIPGLGVANAALPTWAPGRIFAAGDVREQLYRLVFEGDENHTVRATVDRIAEALVSLPADEQTRQPVTFLPPGALDPKPAAGDDATAAKTPTPEPAAQLQGRDVSHGLVLVVTNVNDPTDRIVKWIGILPAHPSTYVDVKNVRYVGKNMRADLQLLHPQSIPAVRDMPVSVLWTNLDLARFVNRQVLAKLSDEEKSQRGDLWAEVPPTTPECYLQLTVDDYPRAFNYVVRCLENEAGQSLEDRQLDIRIVGITPQWKTPKPDEPPAETLVTATPDGLSQVVFRSDRDNPCTHLHVRLQLDVPKNAFESATQPATVQLNEVPLYSDRQVKTTLAKLGPDGSLLLAMQVSDHQVPIYVEGKTPVRIRAEVRMGEEKGANSQIMAILDGEAPRVVSLDNLPSRIEKGKVLPLDVSFTDNSQSGVERLVVAIDKNANGIIEEGEVQKTYPIPRDASRQSVELPTTEVDLSRDGYHVLAQVTDRVGIPSAVLRSDTVVRVEPMKKVAPAKRTGTIWGTVTINNRPVQKPSGTVTIKELQQTKALDGPEFRFDDVPMEKTYTLQVRIDDRGYPFISDPDAGPTATPKPPASAKPTDNLIEVQSPTKDKKGK